MPIYRLFSRSLEVDTVHAAQRRINPSQLGVSPILDYKVLGTGTRLHTSSGPLRVQQFWPRVGGQWGDQAPGSRKAP